MLPATPRSAAIEPMFADPKVIRAKETFRLGFLSWCRNPG